MQTLREKRSKKKEFTKSMLKWKGLQSGTRRHSKQAKKSRGARQAGHKQAASQNTDSGYQAETQEQKHRLEFKHTTLTIWGWASYIHRRDDEIIRGRCVSTQGREQVSRWMRESGDQDGWESPRASGGQVYTGRSGKFRNAQDSGKWEVAGGKDRVADWAKQKHLRQPSNSEHRSGLSVY